MSPLLDPVQSHAQGKILVLLPALHRYFGGSQWRVAARQPKGLACIIPWEGMSDYYRDRCRQGGIYSDGFIKFWWNRQVITNQYGLAGKAARNWGEQFRRRINVLMLFSRAYTFSLRRS